MTDLPARFGKYQLLERIGVGGMAEIFRAKAEGPSGFEKTLVIKRILPELANNRAFTQLLVGEAKVTSLLDHPNIVQIYELGEVEGQYYIAMELVDGTDLLNLLSRCTRERLRVPIEIALHVVSEVCRGLAHAHAANDTTGRPLNVIHRDVSPSNVLLSKTGDVKIMDFGVARADLGLQAPEHERGVLKGKLGKNPTPMPPLEMLPDETLAAALTYVRRSFGNEATAVSVATIAEMRRAIIVRGLPYSEKELEELRAAAQ